MVPMADGTRLATDVYVPAGAGPWPAILIRHPYASCIFMPLIGSYMADHGYAAVIQLVRGKNRSEGTADPFVQELQDGHDTLDWIEGSAWSDGRACLFGDSYYGFTVWAAAASGHRSLRALGTRMASSDVGGDWMYQGDVFNLGPVAEWAAYTWTNHELTDFVSDWSVRPLSDLVPAWIPGKRLPVLDEWAARDPGDPHWNKSIYRRAKLPADGLGLPTLHRAAWWDPFRRGQLADWRIAKRTSAAEQRLTIDATDHYDHPWHPDGPPVVDMMTDFGTFTPYLPQHLDEALGFFDVHVRGDGNASSGLPPVRFHVAGGDWHTSTSWPPTEARELTLHVTPGGLSERQDNHSRALEWTHDPADLVPSPLIWWASALEIPDQRDLADRADTLTFDWEVGAEPVDLAGMASAELEIAADRSSATVVAQLMDVYPDGRAVRITEGARRLTAGADSRCRASVDLGPVGYRLRAGHRLRLHVSSSLFPRYMPDPGVDDHPWTTERRQATGQRLFAGGGSGSQLRLARL
jgi:uncharacterized protein